MPALPDYSEAIHGQFLHGFEIPPGTIRFLHSWKVPILAAVEMCAVSLDPGKMPPIPEAMARAEMNLLRAEVVAGNL